MITLGELTAWLLVALVIAWIWRGHGVRERALAFVRQHCDNEKVQLLDGNVAFKGWRLMPDGKGQKRLARLYGFEFTVTSQERLNGTVAMFGRYLGRVELQAYPVPNGQQEDCVVDTQKSSYAPNHNVVELRHWQGSKKSDAEH
ncbi:DUF3301 domain-containing protein [Pseudomonas sp. C27(2019)]|uniref:DUF3301 domain-containing protein n=1 Tax=Pseudomonas sp. C27(2019) TaxID=2604941 RepID=UPI0015B69947|nr:DUF3301 domain-containing protein [Pseudomonas sp. C27(2019)]